MGALSGAPGQPLTAPEKLRADHDLADFTSGAGPLDTWLKQRGLHNEREGGSGSFVVASGPQVVSYYSLAAGSVLPSAATGRVKRHMPDPVPVILLGRLAIDRRWQGRGLGSDLLWDAVLRTLTAGRIIGVRALLVHAISDHAKAFYEKHGFRVSPIEPMTLMITLLEAARMFDE